MGMSLNSVTVKVNMGVHGIVDSPGDPLTSLHTFPPTPSNNSLGHVTSTPATTTATVVLLAAVIDVEF